jgi:serine/threonine protein phosphatase PrpC
MSSSMLTLYHNSISPIASNKKIFEATTDIGLRPTQEDRFVLVPEFFNSNASFAGIFDGTVGDDASEFISKNIGLFLAYFLK